MAIGSTVYSWSYFKEINGSFYIPEDRQQDLLYWALQLEHYLYQCIYTPKIVFLILGCWGKPILSLFVKSYFY